MPLRLCLVVILAAIACLQSLSMQAQPKPGPQPEPTIWIVSHNSRVPTDRQLDPVRFSDGAEKQLGDPALGRWAEKMCNRVDTLNETDLKAWLTIVAYYRIEKAEPALLNAAQKLIKRKRVLGDLRHEIFYAFALTATPKSVTKIRRMLKAPVKHVSTVRADDTREVGHRPVLAITLFRLGDTRVFDEMTNQLRQMLLDKQNKRSYNAFIFEFFMGSYHSELFQRVQTLQKAPELQAIGTQNTLKAIIKHMKVNPLSLEELHRLSENQDIKRWNERVHAIGAIAELGGPDDLDRLIRLHNVMRARPNEKNAEFVVTGSIARAVVLMRCRLWKELAEK